MGRISAAEERDGKGRDELQPEAGAWSTYWRAVVVGVLEGCGGGSTGGLWWWEYWRAVVGVLEGCGGGGR